MSIRTKLHCKAQRGKNDWSYALHFLQESGKEEDIEAVEDLLEEDEWFDMLVDAAQKNLVK